MDYAEDARLRAPDAGLPIAVFAQSGHGFSFDVVKRARNRSREAVVHQIHALEVFHLDQPRRRRAGKGVAL